MSNLDLSEPRSGGLMLCQCGHMKSFHFNRPLYYLSPGGDAQGNPAPLTEGEPCAHCDCKGYVQGEFQGYRMRQDPHAAQWEK